MKTEREAEQAIMSKTNLSPIINDGALHWVALDSLDHAKELDYPLKHPNDRVQVIGSCNGWVCIVNIEDDIVLWNISTKEYHIVPYTPDESPRVWEYMKHSGPSYGFGYDSINDDYKVLRVQQFVSKDYGSFKSEAMVYSVKRSSWRKTKGLHYYIQSPQESGVFVGCALHWVAATKPSSNVPSLILSFDVGAEKYSEVPLPEGMGFEHSFTVGGLGGCLCVMTCSYKVDVDIWVMKDFMVKESWTKLSSIAKHSPCQSLRPLAYSESGDKVLLEDGSGDFLWCDVMEKKLKKMKIPGLQSYFRQGSCLASLISPSTDREVVGKKRQAKDETKQQDGNKKIRIF